MAKVEGKKVTDRYAPYNEEHKRVLKHTPGKKAIEECQRQALILADYLFLALDGKWTQRNWNIIVFGASGAGKTRYFIIPNTLQLDGCYIIVDPSGELEQQLGGVLIKNGYIIKRLSTDDMTKSNRFNPLFYIRTTSDILVVVNTLLENTQEGAGKVSGDADFWRKASQALLCAIIGYLVEVLPIEQRNFSNVLEILRMNNLDEHADATEETDFDRLFMALGDANPASYAYHQYLTFKKAPAKTALNILISTAVLISQYKIIVERMGKETVKTLSFGNSRGKMGSVSVNKQEVGRELMSRIQIEQMSNTECLV